jgi:hypothetical protein
VVTYHDFLNRKSQLGGDHGFSPVWMPGFLFSFQAALVEWALKKGRAAIFADCGLGKTPMQLVWAQNVAVVTGRPVLILTPLAVSHQTVKEGEKFGIECHRSSDGKVRGEIMITNYERLHYFDPADFAGCVCDESSAIKHFSGKRQGQVTQFMKKMPYRLLCTATAAPNDYIELGTSSEALGYMGYMDMLAYYFKNDNSTCDTKRSSHHGGQTAKWRFKMHAQEPFWKYVCSWARTIRKPSDFGFDDNGFVLPPLDVSETIVKASRPLNGKMFVEPAMTLAEQREERKATLNERCEMVSELVDHDRPSLVWCQYNHEADLLEKMIPGARQVSGAMTDEQKESVFMDFVSGNLKKLITKPKIGAFGLNFQHCAHMTFFPSHSFEQYYQGVRRCWRFGQKNPVKVDIVTTEGEMAVLKNLQRKAAAADEMFTSIIKYMNNAMRMVDRNGYDKPVEVPKWLS